MAEQFWGSDHRYLCLNSAKVMSENGFIPILNVWFLALWAATLLRLLAKVCSRCWYSAMP